MKDQGLFYLANRNLLDLEGNAYPGRGIVIGLDESGQFLIQIYWIMGRSADSRNRIFVSREAGQVSTEAADEKSLKDPSLIIYTAMAQSERSVYVVSNGHQTNHVLSHHALGISLEKEMLKWNYEPDAPNSTARITAVSFFSGKSLITEMSIVKKSSDSAAAERELYSFPLESMSPGLGNCLSTYAGDGKPLPPFRGEPYLLPLNGSGLALAHSIWNVLDESNRVSLALKSIDIRSGEATIMLVNKYRSVVS